MYELIQEKTISISVDQDELTKLITEIDPFVTSVVKYPTSYSFVKTVPAKGLVTVTLGLLEINPFPVKMSMYIKGI